MDKKIIILYLAMVFILTVTIFILFPFSFTSILFAGIFILNFFLFLDVLKKK
ncbi:MAG: hypothetical protein N3E50_04280 [Candidatus Goldbacteria bacterium]|nr:hypothetical protein [Candidatus Goldiibacteriota bacterium]